MITQTFKMQFQCVMWITRHSSIWIANTSIYCSLPSQLRKLAKSGSWYCHLQWQCTQSCVTYLIARKVPMERGWVALYLYATFKSIGFRTMGLWIWYYLYFDTHCTRLAVSHRVSWPRWASGPKRLRIGHWLYVVFRTRRCIFDRKGGRQIVPRLSGGNLRHYCIQEPALYDGGSMVVWVGIHKGGKT